MPLYLSWLVSLASLPTLLVPEKIGIVCPRKAPSSDESSDCSYDLVLPSTSKPVFFIGISPRDAFIEPQHRGPDVPEAPST